LTFPYASSIEITDLGQIRKQRMKNKSYIVGALIIGFISGSLFYMLNDRLFSTNTNDVGQSTSADGPSDFQQPVQRYMINLSLHTRDEIEGMLQRAEQLSKKMRADRAGSGIALILHGPEIKLFTKKAYPENKYMVDLAKRLDQQGIVDLKICRRALRDLGVDDTEVPPFIEFVSDGEKEIKRLEESGYVSL
jgi:intracellular sulfur oxidation DsrE/DsrF family protein